MKPTNWEEHNLDSEYYFVSGYLSLSVISCYVSESVGWDYSTFTLSVQGWQTAKDMGSYSAATIVEKIQIETGTQYNEVVSH